MARRTNHKPVKDKLIEESLPPANSPEFSSPTLTPEKLPALKRANAESALRGLATLAPAGTEPPEACGTCRFWRPGPPRPDGGVPFGQCKRRLLSVIAPGRLTPLGPEGVFPVTRHDEWCGEYELLCLKSDKNS